MILYITSFPLANMATMRTMLDIAILTAALGWISSFEWIQPRYILPDRGSLWWCHTIHGCPGYEWEIRSFTGYICVQQEHVFTGTHSTYLPVNRWRCFSLSVFMDLEIQSCDSKMIVTLKLYDMRYT